MNTFLKNSLRTLGLLLIINLAACSSSDNDYNDNAPNEGVWRGLLTFDEVDGLGAVVDDGSYDVDVVFADGRVMIITADDDDMFMYSGTYEYSDSDEEIEGDALEYRDCIDFNCKATGNDMLFMGAETEPGIMNLDFDVVDENEDILESGTIELTFSIDDGEGSSIDDIKGDWVTNDGDDGGLAITVYKDGSFFGVFDHDTCNIEGEISILDPEYNLYDATSTILDCDPVTGVYIGFAAVNYGDDDDDLLTIIGSNKDYSFFVDLFRDWQL